MLARPILDNDLHLPYDNGHTVLCCAVLCRVFLLTRALRGAQLLELDAWVGFSAIAAPFLKALAA